MAKIMSRTIQRGAILLVGVVFFCAAAATWLVVSLPKPDLAAAIINELEPVRATLPERHVIREVLHNPVSVVGWSHRGIALATGVTVQLPGIRRLPASSRALSMAVRQGVEVQPDQHVIGLLQVWHWCGNDPVGQHLARVDLSSLLLFLGEAEPTPGATAAKAGEYRKIMGFSEYGWDVTEFEQYQDWLKGSPRS